jgi:hypothetical protein
MKTIRRSQRGAGFARRNSRGAAVLRNPYAIWTGEDARLSTCFYIMPTGGAGSLGSPALDSGILIMMPASPAITTRPTIYDGC